MKSKLFNLAILVGTCALLLMMATRGAGPGLYAVTSGSMSPGIPVGAAVLVVPCSFERIQVGDVVT